MSLAGVLMRRPLEPNIALRWNGLASSGVCRSEDLIASHHDHVSPLTFSAAPPHEPLRVMIAVPRSPTQGKTHHVSSTSHEDTRMRREVWIFLKDLR